MGPHRSHSGQGVDPDCRAEGLGVVAPPVVPWTSIPPRVDATSFFALDVIRAMVGALTVSDLDVRQPTSDLELDSAALGATATAMESSRLGTSLNHQGGDGTNTKEQL